MTNYFAVCVACGWQSQQADTAEVATVMGFEHLDAIHPALDQAEGALYLRVYNFDTVDATAAPIKMQQAHARDQAPPPPQAAPPSPPVVTSTVEPTKKRRGKYGTRTRHS